MAEKTKSGAAAMQQHRAVKQQQGPGSAETPIEDRVFALPGLVACEKIPPVVLDFYAKIAPRILLPSTARAVLRAFATVDIKAEKVGALIHENPYYEFHFMRQIEVLSKREVLPSVESAIVLLGMQKTRDLILSLQLVRLVKDTHPELDASGKLKVAPDQVLKYALATEEALSQFKRDFSDNGYSAGVVFDLLMLLMEEAVADPSARKKAAQLLDDTHKHAIKTAKIAVELARTLPDFGAKRYLLPLCMLQGIGRVVMAMLDPSFMDFQESCAKAGLARPITRFSEERKYGIGSAALGVLTLQCLRIFKPLERAALLVEQPYLLKTRDRNQYQLAAMVSLSANVATQFQVPKGTDDPIIQQWRGPELADFKVDGRMLVDALPRVKL